MIPMAKRFRFTAAVASNNQTWICLDINEEFGSDGAVNNNLGQVDWTTYRLSLSQMESISSHSSHFRATCSYPTDDLEHTDYARFMLKGWGLFETWAELCKLYAYLNIREFGCHNSTALTKLKPRKTLLINSSNRVCRWTKTVICQWRK